MNELKPCPFCGGGRAETEIITDDNGEYGYHTVMCKECWSEGPPTFSDELAIIKWNKRAYDYDMPAIVRQNQQLKAELASLQELVFGDGERDTDALINALQQYANHNNWTRDAEIEYSIDDYVESGHVHLDMPIVWKCGGPGYLLAERALNGE